MHIYIYIHVHIHYTFILHAGTHICLYVCFCACISRSASTQVHQHHCIALDTFFVGTGSLCGCVYVCVSMILFVCLAHSAISRHTCN